MQAGCRRGLRCAEGPSISSSAASVGPHAARYRARTISNASAITSSCNEMHAGAMQTVAPPSAPSSALRRLRRHPCFSSRPEQRLRSSLLCRAEPEAGGDVSGSGPLTAEQLRQLSDRETQEQEQALGDAWRDQFEGDVEGLYDYVQR